MILTVFILLLAASTSVAPAQSGTVLFKFRGQSALATWVVYGPSLNSTFFTFGFVRVLVLQGVFQTSTGMLESRSAVIISISEFQQTAPQPPNTIPLFLFDGSATGVPVFFDTGFPKAPTTSNASVDVTGFDQVSGHTVSLDVNVSWSGSNPAPNEVTFHLPGGLVFFTDGFIDQTSSAQGGISGTAFDITNMGGATFSQLGSLNQGTITINP